MSLIKNKFSTDLKVILTIFLLILFSSSLTSCNTGNDQETVRIGALFSLTGNWSTLGNASKAALEIGLEDVNKSFRNNNENIVFKGQVADTQLLPDKALGELKEFKDSGISIVLGPMSSSELAFVKDYADENNIFILSQSSTAGSLSVAGDNIFRFAPDDSLEGEAVVALLLNDNIEHIVPIWRNDAGNSGLESSVRTKFKSAGGSVSDGVVYDTNTANFSTVVDMLRHQVMEAVDTYGGDSVGIYLAGFDEVVKIFALAKDMHILSQLKWYGSDGVVFSEALLKNSGGSSEFADYVEYPNPIFGLDPALENRWGPIAERIKKRSGVVPDAFALSVYDTVRVIALSYLNAISPDDTASFIDSFVKEASLYNGITGSTELNNAGDRKRADFDFWGIRIKDGEYVWKKIAYFHYDTHTITVF